MRKKCRCSITSLRSGCAGNVEGPTFIMPVGKTKNPAYSDEFLRQQGAAEFSSVIMTPSGYLTADAWEIIYPLFIKGVRKVVENACARHGVDAATAALLLIGLGFDGCKIHTKSFICLIKFAASRILCLLEGRDSSEINQPFDKFVARAGKKRAARTLDQLRRSHVTPVIDQWFLVLVVLQMLRDAAASNVWENSFIACNLHPHYRVDVEEWLQRIQPFVLAADKFEDEEINLQELLPAEWRRKPLATRQKWIKVIDESGPAPTWDVDMLAKLREEKMSLSLVAQIFKIYKTEKRIQLQLKASSAVGPSTPATTKTGPTRKDTPSKGSMIYHVWNAKIDGASPLQQFHHAVSVRNRQFGPIAGTTVSAYLDCEISADNKRMLALKPDDLNMYQVLQQSTCRNGKRRKVAKRCLNALGGLSGVARFVNDPDTLKEMQLNLQFAASLEAVKASEKNIKDGKSKASRDKYYQSAKKKCGVGPKQKFFKSHAAKLTIKEIQAVAFVECNGVVIKGRLKDVREKLAVLLPEDPRDSSDEADDGVPDYPTQDPLYLLDDDDDSDSDADSTTINIDVPLNSMVLNDCVEVWWKGDKTWYEGRITGVDLLARTFDVFYFLDKKTLTHHEDHYKVRMAV